MIRIDDLGYPIFIGSGLLADLDWPAGKMFLVTDENVQIAGWVKRLTGDFAGICVLQPGEANKTLASVEMLLDRLIEAGIGRNDHVVALGGGMVGDVAGFAASLLKRGCSWISVPTSLLAQVDSAVGGKTGVNSRHGKNLIGAFHPPSQVVIDPECLDTLPERELRSGYAETVKYGLIGDALFFDWCERHYAGLLAGDREARVHAIETCVRAKARYVLGDEQDRSGQRALLNFGHSFGHAIESETGILHGEAVAIGMAMAMRRSVDLGFCPRPDADRAISHLDAAGLPTKTDIPAERLADRMRHDKKDGTLVLLAGIGRAFLHEPEGRF